MLEDALSVTVGLGAVHDDLEMRNVRIVGDRAMILDWELSPPLAGNGEKHAHRESQSLVCNYQHFKELYPKLDRYVALIQPPDRFENSLTVNPSWTALLASQT